MANFSKGRSAYPDWTELECDMVSDLFPMAKWAEICAALPGRTRGSINQFARKVLKLRRMVNPRERWSELELQKLKNLYPMASDEEIAAALPRHSLFGAQRMASKLGIRRKTVAQRKSRRAINPLFVQLRAIREAKRLSRPMLAEIMGYHQNQLLLWENGNVQPDFQHIEDLANALGYDLVLKERNTGQSIQDAIPWPDKKRLMAGR